MKRSSTEAVFRLNAAASSPSTSSAAAARRWPSPLKQHQSVSSLAAASFPEARSISDSVVSRCSRQTATYDKKNTVFMMYSRSGASTVKKIIPEIFERSRGTAQAATKALAYTTTQRPPEEEVYLLAQWSADPYYKVVIAQNEGVAAIVSAMKAFAMAPGLQECACLALQNLPLARHQQDHVLHAIVTAMLNHQTSVAVQSAACGALSQIPLYRQSVSHPAVSTGVAANTDAQKQEQLHCIQESKQNDESYDDSFKRRLIEVLTHATTMYLPNQHKRTAHKMLVEVREHSWSQDRTAQIPTSPHPSHQTQNEESKNNQFEALPQRQHIG